MIQHHKTTIAITLATLFSMSAIVGMLVSPVSAQTEQDPGQALEIAPPIINITGDPGQTIRSEVTLRDVSTSPLRVTTEINDFTANGEDGTPKILLDEEEPTPYSLVSWIDPIAPLLLEPKQLKKVPVTIKIPSNAAPGGYYGVIRFSGTAPDIETSGVSLSASLGTLVILRVKGDAKEQLETQELFTAGQDDKKSSLFEGVPIRFITKIKNTGNTIEQPTGQIIITDMFGKKAAVVNVNLAQSRILPDSTRKFSENLEKSATGNMFLFGLYNAKMTLNYGDDQTVIGSTSFWVIPYKIILLVIGLIVATILAGRIFLKRYADRAVGKSRGKSRRR